MPPRFISAARIFAGFAAGFTVMLAFAAWAGPKDDCRQKRDRGLRVDACTVLINTEDISRRARAIAHFNRGSARDGMGEIVQAIEDYDAALILNPKMGAAYYNRANAYFSLDDYARAIADYDQAVRIDPAAARAYNNRGEAYSRLGDDPQAIEDFNQALQIDPGYADAYRNRGVVYESMGQYDRAVLDWVHEIRLGGAERARWWQEYLTAKGHYSGEIDGINNPGVWAGLTACALDPDC